MLVHRRDPYGAEVSREIQVAYYGHALDTAGADRGRDEQRFAYPVYVVFFLAPTVEMSFEQMQAMMRWVLALLMVASVLLWVRALRWRPPVVVTLTILIFELSSPTMVQALRLQQLAVLVAFFLTSCAVLISRGKLFWAGCFLACATIKPQLAVLPVIWMLIWVVGHWHKRQRLAWGFGGTLALLMGVGQYILPGWFGEFLQGLVEYRHYAGMSSLLDTYLTPAMARPVGAIALIALLVWCWSWRRDSAEEEAFFLRWALVSAVAILVLPPLLPPFNQVLLLPGVLILIRKWNSLWNSHGAVRAVFRLAAGAALLPWVGASIFGALSLLAPAAQLRRVWNVPLMAGLLLPPVVVALLIFVLRASPASLPRGRLDLRVPELG